MAKKGGAMSFVKGAGIGMLVGSMAGMAGYGYMQSHKKGMKKNVNKASKALRNMGELVDNVTSMF